VEARDTITATCLTRFSNTTSSTTWDLQEELKASITQTALKCLYLELDQEEQLVKLVQATRQPKEEIEEDTGNRTNSQAAVQTTEI
jgi:hypothetical protein